MIHCIECDQFDGTCTLEKIYASGYLNACPYSGKGEPIITASGCSYEPMMEVLLSSEESATAHIRIYPVQYPGLDAWQGKIMVCFDGKGRMDLHRAETLPEGAVWMAWHRCLSLVKEMNHPDLIRLIPLINRRIDFDYSVIRYEPIQRIIPQSTSGKNIQESESERNNLLETTNPNISGLKVGPQMELFAC